jgi:sugar/nucleoside kinase (ribokinase family)
VIVVIGSPIGWLRDGVVVPTGTAARTALAAAAAGRLVQLVGRTGDDPTADALLLALTQGGVGHAALLRDLSRPTTLAPEPVSEDPADTAPDGAGDFGLGLTTPPLDAADVDLGLRYLTEFGVVILAEPADPGVVRVVAEAARWHAARLVLVVEPGSEPTDGLPPDAIVFEAPSDDRDGDFAALVGRFAAALDDGTNPADAFRASIEAQGWTEGTTD